MAKRIKRYSPSKVLGPLYYPHSSPCNSHMKKAINKGRLVHSKLGFDDTEIFRRYLKDGDELYLISGMPDKVDEERGVVEELKTFDRLNRSKLENITIPYAEDQLAFYVFVTGLEDWELYLYNIGTKKYHDILEGSCKESEAKKTILDRIHRLKKLDKYRLV